MSHRELIDREQAFGMQPLLPRQREVMDRLVDEEARGLEDARLRGGALVEPLHTRRRPRSDPYFRPRIKEGQS